MPETLIHKPTNTLFLSVKQNEKKTKYRTEKGAIFPVAECEIWKENFPPMAIAMPPEIGQVVQYKYDAFIVVRRAIDKESGQKRLWYCDVETRSCGYYPLDDCAIVSDDLINGWVEAIALERHHNKEDTAQYRAVIQEIPQPIRDLCIVKSFNKILATMPLGKEGDWF